MYKKKHGVPSKSIPIPIGCVWGTPQKNKWGKLKNPMQKSKKNNDGFHPPKSIPDINTACSLVVQENGGISVHPPKPY